jgi:hypothetical protein
MDSVGQLMQAGCNSVKIEGAAGQLDLMAHIVESGVPVMGHLGLTPQSVEAFGGHKVQGRNEGQAGEILASAKRLEEAGCFAIVLECVPSELARLVSQEVTIPTIGIGAGPHTDGQVLVLQDMLGMNPNFKPKFLRRYADGHAMLTQAVNRFHAETQSHAAADEEDDDAFGNEQTGHAEGNDPPRLLHRLKIDHEAHGDKEDGQKEVFKGQDVGENAVGVDRFADHQSAGEGAEGEAEAEPICAVGDDGAEANDSDGEEFATAAGGDGMEEVRDPVAAQAPA